MRWFSHRRRGPRTTPEKMPHEDRAPEDDSQTKRCCSLSVFCPQWSWPLTLTFKLGWDFCRMYLTAKFHHLMFNRLEVIMLTNKQTDKQMPLKTSTSLHCATLMGNHFCHKQCKYEHFGTRVTQKRNVTILRWIWCFVSCQSEWCGCFPSPCSVSGSCCFSSPSGVSGEWLFCVTLQCEWSVLFFSSPCSVSGAWLFCFVSLGPFHCA